MSDLQNQTPANTYKGLLQVGDYTNGVDGTAKYVSDGEGTNSALSVSESKVGVGTPSPSAELDVNGNVIADEYALGGTGSSSSAVAIHAPTTNELAIRTNSTEVMRIDSDGSVGIGITSPTASLHIENSTDPFIKVGYGGNNGEHQIRWDSATVGIHANYNQVSTENARRIVLGVDADEKMSILHNGRVGIGTTSPSAPLEVASTTGGVIMPRMTTTQRDAISSPTDGEMIYNTTTNKFQGRANGAWVDFH